MNYTRFIFILIAIGLLFGCSKKATLDLTNNDYSSPPPANNTALAFHKSEALVDTHTMARWDTLLFQVGEKVPDFDLHTPEGKTYNLYEELEQGTPIVLITASYTCYVSRDNLPAVNKLAKKYGRKLKFVMVYTIEAHALDTVSPYSINNDKWVAEENTVDGIEANKPKTYQERRDLCEMWQDKFEVRPSVLVDNPQNEFWRAYGQAPNMAYLITPDRKVFWRQIWLHPESFEEKIKLLLKDKA